jgi:hypothetical protein
MWLRQSSSTDGVVAGCAAEPTAFAAEPMDFTGREFTRWKLMGLRCPGEDLKQKNVRPAHTSDH